MQLEWKKRSIILMGSMGVALALIILGYLYQENIYYAASASFYLMPYRLYMAVLYFLTGAGIAFPFFAYQYLQEGKWQFEWLLFILVGIPMLYVNLIPVLHYVPMELPWVQTLMPLVAQSYTIIFTLAGILSGFLCLQLFNRKKYEAT